MKIKRKILFFLDIEKDKPDAKIRMRIRYEGILVNFNVGYRVDTEKWSNKSQRCNSGTTHGKKKVKAAEINKELERLYELAENTFNSFEVDGVIPSPDEYRIAFNDANAIATGTIPRGKKDFFELFDEFTTVMGRQNMWTAATFTKFSSIKQHLERYNPKLSIYKLSEDDLQGFISYMSEVIVHPPKHGDENKKHQVGLRNTTIAKNISFLRWFLRWAQSRGYYQGNLHTTWKPKFKGIDGNQKEVIYLEWDELMHVLNLEIPKEKQYLARVRDVFCFQCFTGLRYSDIAKLTRSDVKDGYIQLVTQKTSDGLRIELNKYSQSLINKYKDAHFDEGKVFPVVSNVNSNIYLKELGKLAGIDEPQRIVYFLGNRRIEEVYPKYDLLTTHAGRRTFVVNALTLGIPAEVIMRWTGHSDFKSMKPYVKIVDQLREKEMNKFNQK